uniref:Variant surface glycoprotein 1125.12 n=1 Tax=Trypanosoma brucei TaxID=5691 RepID=A0A1J0R545_9TRYP|nr:variant surface glycoprotein 1125.12 [Trypanosoma brucei]
MQKLIAIYIAIHLCATGKAAYDTIGALNNKAAFDALCALTALANWKDTEPSKEATRDTSYSKILKLNMTLSEPQWQKLFDKQGPNKARPEQPPESQRHNTDWEQMWPTWVATATALEHPKAVTETLQAAGLGNAADQTREEVRRKLQPLIARAKTLNAKLQKLDDASKELTNEKIAKMLNKAIYGEDVETVTAYNPAKAFKGGVQSNAQTSCKAAGTGARAETVAATLVCVCHKENGGNEPDEPCNGHITHTGNSGAAFAQTKTEFEDIVKACGVGKPKRLTANYITSAVANVLNQITAKDRNSYLGIFLQTGCDGSKSNGLCVEYTGVTAENRQKLQDIPWVKTLTELATDLQQRDDALKAAAQIHLMLDTTLAEANKLGEATTVENVRRPSAAASTNGNDRDLAAVAKENCATHNNNKKACTADTKCTWKGGESEKGDCEVDETKIKDQTETSGTAERTAGADAKTNTTGSSNSFVIHKAPLLLVVLLF